MTHARWQLIQQNSQKLKRKVDQSQKMAQTLEIQMI
jgi:hypothetical protein